MSSDRPQHDWQPAPGTAPKARPCQGPPTQPGSKILTLQATVDAIAEARAAGKTVAQCHGCFDLVHPGHVRHLKQAAEQADLLLVSLTTDASVDKGDGRPLFPEHLRAENLAALSFVDMVCVNSAPTAETLLERVRPDVYVKGREYETNEDPRFAAERRAVERHGGRVVFTSGDLVFSSSALIHEIALGAASEIAEDPRASALRRLRVVHDLSSETLEPLVQSCRGARAVVVGEVILDTYVSCDSPEVSSESPCLSLRPIEQASFDGGAAVIALHAAGLGAEVTLVTALPDDAGARAFVERMNSAGVNVRSIPHEGPMLEKQRFLVGHDKVVKLDRVHPLTLDTEARARLLGSVREAAAGGVDAAIVSDFGNGLLTRHSLEGVSEILRPLARVLAGDVSGRRSSLLSLRGMDLVTPTEMELRDAVRDYDSSLNSVVWDLMQRSGAEAVVTTLADNGLIMFTRLEGAGGAGWKTRVAAEHVPCLEARPLDTLGCGDALLTASTLALAGGASHVQSAYLGAIAAAVECSRLGNIAVHSQEVVTLLRSLSQAHMRVLSRPLRLPRGEAASTPRV